MERTRVALGGGVGLGMAAGGRDPRHWTSAPAVAIAPLGAVSGRGPSDSVDRRLMCRNETSCLSLSWAGREPGSK